MVKKLFKHEIQAFTRPLIPMYLVMLGVALMGRFVQLFENDSDAYAILFGSSIGVFVISAVVCLVLTVFFCIKRFYSNLFSSEGYLTLTLPVTSTQHILVKNTVAVLAQLTSIVMILLSVCVLTLGDVCIEIFKAGGYLMNVFFDAYNGHAPLLIIEAIVTIIFASSASMMIYYACIAIGQRAKKNRIACSIGAYFVYYLIYQAIGTIFIIIVTVFHEALHLDQFVEYLANNPIVANHLYFGLFFVISAILFPIGFVITKRTMDRKLNLE